MQNLTGHGAADTDVLITFEDFVSGRCGQYEAALAQKQASKLASEADPPSESVTRVQVDDSGYDMRVGNRAGKRKRVILDESDLRRSSREKLAKPDPAPLSKPGRKRKLEQAGPDLKKRKPGRPPGRGPGRPPLLHSPSISSKGPLPAGWSVTLKDSKKEIGKRFKQYKAPDGEIFHSYAKAQDYWEEQGEVPLRQPFFDAKHHKRLAGLPLGWEIQATHRDVGKRQGQVDKHYISPDGQQFDTWAEVQEYCKSHDVIIEAAEDDVSDAELESDFDLADMLHWLHAAAADSPEWPEPGGGPLMQLAFASIRAVLSIDPANIARRPAKPA